MDSKWFAIKVVLMPDRPGALVLKKVAKLGMRINWEEEKDST